MNIGDFGIDLSQDLRKCGFYSVVNKDHSKVLFLSKSEELAEAFHDNTPKSKLLSPLRRVDSGVRRKEYTCPDCGSSNVRIMASVSWDSNKHMWVVGELIKRTNCCLDCRSPLLHFKESVLG